MYLNIRLDIDFLAQHSQIAECALRIQIIADDRTIMTFQPDGQIECDGAFSGTPLEICNNSYHYQALRPP